MHADGNHGRFSDRPQEGVAVQALVDGPGWVDRTTKPIMGLFPLAVEQFLNRAVGIHAPGVTTVTTTARYYTLHGLVADEAARLGLDSDAARTLLRRAEVVYGLMCMAHSDLEGHERWLPAPHGEDRLRAALRHGPVDLTAAAGKGAGRYANASWGFLGAYRGAEMTLGALSKDGFAPGPDFDAAAARSGLGSILEVARHADSVSLEDLGELSGACLCSADRGADGAWLARRFAGRPAEPRTVAGVLGQTMQMIAAILDTVQIQGVGELGDAIMYDAVVTDHANSGEIWRQWRGLRQRAESVNAWRQLWTHMCDYLSEEGAATRARLGELLADELPDVSVAAFEAGLPAVLDASGSPLRAERDPSLAGRGPVEHAVAILALGAHRHRQFAGDAPERLGFEGGPDERRLQVEELSPHWVATLLETWRERSMRDLGAHLATVMVNRAQRVAMSKAYFRRSDGRFVMPVRIMVHDDLVIRQFGEVARFPSLRLTQLMSITRQVGLFAIGEDSVWRRGPRGDLLG